MTTDLSIIAADIPGQLNRFYLIDQNFDFIPEVKALIDSRINSRRFTSPNSTKSLCNQLRWYYRFLNQKNLAVLEVQPRDLADFSLWLRHPYRRGQTQPNALSIKTVNQVQSAVASLYKFLVRRGELTESPVVYEDIPRWRGASVDHSLLGHLSQGKTVGQRMEISIKPPKTLPKTVNSRDFQAFLESIGVSPSTSRHPSQFRNRLMVLILRETGLRCGELLGLHMEDIDFGANGLNVRFRADNENGARAKAGYGRDRFVFCPPELFALLDTYISEVWVEANHKSAYLWLTLQRHAVDREGRSSFGKPLSQTAVNEMFDYYSSKSGVKLHPHMLRHTHATDLVRSYLKQDKPVDWKFISDRLGHSSVVTTIETYVHLTKEDHKHAYQQYVDKREAAYVHSE